MAFYGCNRPPTREPGLPLTLLHPVFGKFVEDAKMISPTRNDYVVAHDPSQSMCKFYINEATCLKEICRVLLDYGIPIQPGPIGASEDRTDGHVCTAICPKFILELKNEIGWKGAEPSLQALIDLIYYRVFCHEYNLWDDVSTCHPCLIAFLVSRSQSYHTRRQSQHGGPEDQAGGVDSDGG
jgi:hypothetical protein